MRDVIRKAQVLAIFCGCLFLSAPGAHAQTTTTVGGPEIWFDPLEMKGNPDGPGVIFPYDFSALVASTSEWKNAASHTAVLGINIGLVDFYPTETAPDVSTVVDMINANNFKVVAAGGFINTGTTFANAGAACTITPIEGVSDLTTYNYERSTYNDFHKWKLAGGRIDYIAMDGAVGAGYFRIASSCHYTPQEVAVRAAATANMILQDFPDAQIISYEGTRGLPLSEWEPVYQQFLEAFDAVASKPISALSMDQGYWPTDYPGFSDWVEGITAETAFLHSLGLKAGLFMDADDGQIPYGYVESADGEFVETASGEWTLYPTTSAARAAITPMPLSNDAWMQEVREHMQLLYDNQVPLDFLNISSWASFPTENLPETDPSAFSSLVDYAYTLWTTTMTTISGTFSNSSGSGTYKTTITQNGSTQEGNLTKTNITVYTYGDGETLTDKSVITITNNAASTTTLDQVNTVTTVMSGKTTTSSSNTSITTNTNGSKTTTQTSTTASGLTTTIDETSQPTSDGVTDSSGSLSYSNGVTYDFTKTSNSETGLTTTVYTAANGETETVNNHTTTVDGKTTTTITGTGFNGKPLTPSTSVTTASSPATASVTPP